MDTSSEVAMVPRHTSPQLLCINDTNKKLTNKHRHYG